MVSVGTTCGRSDRPCFSAVAKHCGDRCVVSIGGRNGRDFCPEEASVLGPEYSASSDQMAGDVPISVVEISRIPLSEIVAIAHCAIHQSFCNNSAFAGQSTNFPSTVTSNWNVPRFIHPTCEAVADGGSFGVYRVRAGSDQLLRSAGITSLPPERMLSCGVVRSPAANNRNDFQPICHTALACKCPRSNRDDRRSKGRRSHRRCRISRFHAWHSTR